MEKSKSKNTSLRVAVFQYNITWEESEKNIIKIERLSEIILKNIDVLILPEAFNTGFSVKKIPFENFDNSSTINWMKSFAVENGIAICGSLFIQDKGEIYNRFIWADPNQLVSYDKRHLFSIGGEDQKFSSGEETVLIEYKGWKIFPQICYDLRFPVWSRNVNNYDLLINVANWPAARNGVWKKLLKARAIENQAYVIGANRIGMDAEGVFYEGNSMFINAKGKTIKKAKNEECILATVLDLNELHRFRKKFNTIIDRDQFSIEN